VDTERITDTVIPLLLFSSSYVLILNRLINTMTLLDCAFSFFANFPCRLTLSEMRFDLPCEDIYFSSLHPFSERSFTFSRRITLNEAFHSLFLHKPTMPTSNPIKKNNPLGLNPMDMFILIHSEMILLLILSLDY
jgi:hypothetical protein